MAKHKRKHSSRPAMSGIMRVAKDRRGHDMGEHLHMSGSGQDRQASSSQGYEPRSRNGQTFEERMDLNKRMRIMQTNNGNMGPVSEDFSRPCGLPYGAIQRDLGNGDYYSMNGYRVGDLYEQVDKTMREDAAALKSITKPSNW